MPTSIRIVIEYKLHGTDAWQRIELLPEKYFDLEPNEEIELDSVPQYAHAVNYLDIDAKSVAMTRLTILDERNSATRVIRETFWNNGENRAIERVDSQPTPYWECIFESKVSIEPIVWEIARLIRMEDMLKPVYHGFIRENEDGSQTETRIY